jgi:thioredoxin reductase
MPPRENVKLVGAPLLEGRKVIVVGAGNSAGQAALNLAEYAERVTMLCRGPSLAASLSGYLLDRIRANDRIDVRMQSRVTAVAGDGRLREERPQSPSCTPTSPSSRNPRHRGRISTASLSK